MLDKKVSDKEFASILADAEEEHLTDKQIDTILEMSIKMVKMIRASFNKRIMMRTWMSQKRINHHDLMLCPYWIY